MNYQLLHYFYRHLPQLKYVCILGLFLTRVGASVFICICCQSRFYPKFSLHVLEFYPHMQEIVVILGPYGYFNFFVMNCKFFLFNTCLISLESFWTENKKGQSYLQLDGTAVPHCWFCFGINKLQPQFLCFSFLFSYSLQIINHQRYFIMKHLHTTLSNYDVYIN